MTEFINRTPHVINVYAGDEVILSVQPTPPMLRVDEISTPGDPLTIADGAEVPTTTVAYADAVADLPDPQDDVIIIVSMVTARALADRGRTDLVFPHDPVRDGSGQIIGCRALGRIPASA